MNHCLLLQQQTNLISLDDFAQHFLRLRRELLHDPLRILGLNLQQNNFLGTGRRVGVSLNSARWQDVISFNYTNPYFTEDGVSRGFGVFYRKSDLSKINVASYTTDTWGGSVNFGYPISETQRLGFSIGVTDTKITSGQICGAGNRWQPYVSP